MTAEAKIRMLAQMNTQMLTDFATAGIFRWFSPQLQPGYLKVGAPCVRMACVGTVRTYAQAGLQTLSQPRFQLEVLAYGDQTTHGAELARLLGKDVIAFLGTINLVTGQQFASPPTTPNQFPQFVLNEMDRMDYNLTPPAFVRLIEFRAFNEEAN